MLDIKDPFKRKYIKINDVPMAYVDEGSGAPIVFLHGNPTCSYIWRNVIPYLQGSGRCIAPDLVGMGDSGKLPDSGVGSYTYADHREYLFGLLDALDLGNEVTLVLHDWGGALGFDWARNHSDRVKALVYMEAMMMPLTWEMMPASAIDAFKGFRTDGVGEKMCLEDNIFVEQVIPMAVLRELGEEEKAAYRKPYLEAGESRRPTLTWPRQIPIEGEPADVAAVLQANCDWLSHTPIPKLFFRVDPGMMVTGKVLEFCQSFPNQKEITVKGAHYVQEDSADEIGKAIAEWI